jgi:hypothetical protein
MFGIHDGRGIGVRVYAAGSGALLFADTNRYIATVISSEVLAEVMMRHAVDDSFARAMRESGVQDPDDPMCVSVQMTPAYQLNWFSVFSRLLADESTTHRRSDADQWRGTNGTLPIPEHHGEHPHPPDGCRQQGVSGVAIQLLRGIVQ